MSRILVLALLLAACSRQDPAPETAMAISSPVDAEFRDHARLIYDAAVRRSCRASRAADRAASLAAELQRIEAFEARTSDRARSQLALARSDSVFGQTERTCDDDRDPKWAKSNLESARRDIRNGLEEVERLAPALSFTIPREATVVPRAAQFRNRVRRLVFRFTFTPCDSSAPPADAKEASPVAAEIAAFERRLEPTPYATHYTLAEADAAYEMSITLVECADLPGDPAQHRRERLAEVRKEIAEIEAIIAGR